MKKIYLTKGHYTINALRYLNINKDSTGKTCLNNQQVIDSNHHLTQLLINSFANDFSSNKINWFWCFTHSSFIEILQQAGARCIFKLNYLNYGMLLRNLYKYWENSNCLTCENNKLCCIHHAKENSNRKHIGYICIFKIER